MTKNFPSSLRRKVTNDVGVMTHDAYSFELIPLKLVFHGLLCDIASFMGGLVIAN
jgi:hypothetical protein